MELIDQRTKAIMEGCKERAREAGLRFQDETLEYIVTNRDLLELSPKLMIPTLYDYWVHDVEVLREKGRYELYPGNPYETVINTRPAISFYNDNNPDWLNVMIFYHVLAHIDFFQNNHFFRHTWDYDFNGRALSDKRLIGKLRSEHGQWVDYVIEFSRGIDNLVGFYPELARFHRTGRPEAGERLDYYFDVFLQTVKPVRIHEYLREVERYNRLRAELGEAGEQAFFAEVGQAHPEFEALCRRHAQEQARRPVDLFEYLAEHSRTLNRGEHQWMKAVMAVVRQTALFFQPQIRTKILNEGWASFWHERLFLGDERIRGHEVEFARVNAGVTTLPRVGLNPYALGMQLFYYVEELADRGRLGLDFQRLADAAARERYDAGAGEGRAAVFRVRENFSDFQLVNTFVDQDFVNRHQLFTVGRRLNRDRMVWEYFVQSRKAEDYRRMLLDSLYHPPHIVIDPGRGADGALYLDHRFEGKPLLRDFIPNTLIGLEFLWGAPVQLETSEVAGPARPAEAPAPGEEDGEEGPLQFQRVLYTARDRKVSKQIL